MVNEKIKYMNFKENKGTNFISRGDLVYVDFGPIKDAIGSEQSGERYAIVLQNDVGNFYSKTVIVAACTTKNKTKLPTHVNLGRLFKFSEFDTTVLLEQIRTIDKERIKHNYGKLPLNKMNKIDEALKVSLSLI